MSKGCFRRLVLLTGAMLLIGRYARTSQEQDTQKTPPKSSATISAGIPREELKKEAELKKVMDAGQEAYRQKKYDEAILQFQEGLQLAKHLDGRDEEHVRLFTSDEALDKIGNCYLQLHRYDKAATTFTTLLDLRKQNMPFDSSTSGALVELAAVELMQRNFSKAEAHLAEAVAYTQACVDHFKHSDTYDAQDIVANGDRRLLAQLHTYVGNVYANEGKFDQALAAYEEAFQIGDKFKADAKSQLQIVNSALSIAQLAKRKDKLEIWQARYRPLQVNND